MCAATLDVDTAVSAHSSLASPSPAAAFEMPPVEVHSKAAGKEQQGEAGG